MPSSTADIRAEILAHARELGFDAVRIAPAEEAPDTREHLSEFLAQGRHGSMNWMEKNAEKRAAPASLWPDAKSVVVRIVLIGAFNFDHALTVPAS